MCRAGRDRRRRCICRDARRTKAGRLVCRIPCPSAARSDSSESPPGILRQIIERWRQLLVVAVIEQHESADVLQARGGWIGGENRIRRHRLAGDRPGIVALTEINLRWTGRHHWAADCEPPAGSRPRSRRSSSQSIREILPQWHPLEHVHRAQRSPGCTGSKIERGAVAGGI